MKPLTALDIYVIVNELQPIVGTRVEKVYHSGSDLTFRLFNNRLKTVYLRVKVGSYLALTEYKEKNEKPTNFAMLLRKYLNGYTLREIRQVGHERIVDLVFEKEGDKKILVLELFSKGNVILCEPSFNVIFALKRQFWADRKIQAGKKYILPPKVFDPFTLSRKTFLDMLDRSTAQDVVRFLAVDLSLGGLYSEEVLFRAGVDKSKPLNELTDSEKKDIYTTLREILISIKNMKLKPQVAIREDKLVPLPFDFLTFKGWEKKYFLTYNQAVDYVGTHYKVETIKKKAVIDIDKEIRKLKRVLEEQAERIEEMKIKYEKNKEVGDWIYKNFTSLQDTLNKIHELREKGVSWDEIKEKNLVKRIDEKNGKVYVDMNGEEVKIDITKSLTEVAGEYYDKAKRAKAKIKGIMNSMEEIRKRLSQIEKTKETKLKRVEKKLPKKKESKKWYEKFRWFESSEGFLVVSGKDATTNEILIKKYMEPNDIVLHAEIAGSPFTLIKNGKEAGEKTIEEAAIFTASFSKAWKSGYGSIDVYWINPDQVSKKAPSGEYISKGGFMVYGKKNYLKNVPLELAVGFKDEPIIGPKSAISKVSRFVLIKPGDMKKKDAVDKIRRKLMRLVGEEVDKDSLSRILPSGGIKIEK